MTSRIALINPYFGSFPVWFPAFLLSCEYNRDITWIIPTDCEIPSNHPANVHFVKSSLTELKALADETLNISVSLDRAYKVNDIRPAFGLIYSNILAGYEFWGHCDLDVVWGDIRSFITDDLLDNYDVISARKHKICGHFTLYRNNDYINNLFQKSQHAESAFTQRSSYYFDEVGMTDVIETESSKGALKVYWPKFLLNYKDIPKDRGVSNLPKLLNHWRWEDGKLFEEGDKGGEVMYLHFMTWKKSMKDCFVDHITNNVNRFYVSYSHISDKRSPLPSRLLGLPMKKLFPSWY